MIHSIGYNSKIVVFMNPAKPGPQGDAFCLETIVTTGSLLPFCFELLGLELRLQVSRGFWPPVAQTQNSALQILISVYPRISRT